jgi:hypothetical protein
LEEAASRSITQIPVSPIVEVAVLNQFIMRIPENPRKLGKNNAERTTAYPLVRHKISTKNRVLIALAP